MAQRPSQFSNSTGLGALFIRNKGGQVINTLSTDNETNGQISAAAFTAKESVENMTSLNILIIDDPTQYVHVEDSSGSQLDSSVIIVGTNGISSRMNLSLYFRSWNRTAAVTDGNYACSFYNTSTHRWDTSGCTVPIEQTQLNRYECSCNHLSTFALVRLPRSSTFCNNCTHFLAPNKTCLSRNETQVR